MARRKITATADGAADLPDLTAQQMRFVEGILAGKTGADAYRAAYDASGMLSSTVIAAASRLRANANVSAWLDAARKAGLGNATITLEQHIKRLDRLATIAVESGNIGAAVQAENMIGKASGLYVDRVMDVTPTSPHDILNEVAKHDPGLAAAWAAEHGITDYKPNDGVTKH